MPAWPLRTTDGEEILVINVDPTRKLRLVTQAKELERQFRGQLREGGFVHRANQIALARIQEKALANLEESMAHNRRPDFRTGLLEKAIVDNRYSEATPERVQFFIRSRIFPDVPYYASLEFGDRSQVGKKRWLSFRGVRAGNQAPNYSIDNRRIFNRSQAPSDIRNNRRPDEIKVGRSITFGGEGRVSDRIIGSREFKSRLGKNNEFSATGRVPVIIKRPVPKYAYGTRAGEFFLQRREYKKILEETSQEFRKSLKLGFS